MINVVEWNMPWQYIMEKINLILPVDKTLVNQVNKFLTLYVRETPFNVFAEQTQIRQLL